MRDLNALEWEGVLVKTQWFSDLEVQRVGDGKTTSFWFDNRVAGMCLKQRYPRLYSVAINKNARVGEMGFWPEEGVWRWIWAWHMDLFQ